VYCLSANTLHVFYKALLHRETHLILCESKSQTSRMLSQVVQIVTTLVWRAVVSLSRNKYFMQYILSSSFKRSKNLLLHTCCMKLIKDACWKLSNVHTVTTVNKWDTPKSVGCWGLHAFLTTNFYTILSFMIGSIESGWKHMGGRLAALTLVV